MNSRVFVSSFQSQRPEERIVICYAIISEKQVKPSFSLLTILMMTMLFLKLADLFIIIIIII